MVAYAKGTKAFGFCDRTGFRYPLQDLVWEYKDGKRTGMRIGKDMVDPDHPQNFLAACAWLIRSRCATRAPTLVLRLVVSSQIR